MVCCLSDRSVSQIFHHFIGGTFNTVQIFFIWSCNLKNLIDLVRRSIKIWCNQDLVCNFETQTIWKEGLNLVHIWYEGVSNLVQMVQIHISDL